MQLFAIIARPESNRADRRTVVESFLKRQLNSELVQEYLKAFDEYYRIFQEKGKEVGKRNVRISSSSVRVLKICTEINEELAQPQKLIVLFQLLEFVNSDISGEISDQEMEFINTVSESFNFSQQEYTNLKEFVLFPFERIPASDQVLLIDNNKEFTHRKVKHSFLDGLQGQIRILYVDSGSMYLARYIGQSEMYLNGQILQQDKVFVFNTGSSIRNPQIKPLYYSDIVSRFHIDRIKTKIVFSVNEIEYKFKSGKIGLHKMSFSEDSGHLVGIMGASGAGKSTLLNVLNGSGNPTSGSVTINGFSIHTQKEEVAGLIGHVSQDDLLIEELSVYQNLYYNAKLCFDNYSEEQLVEAVDRVLENLGLIEIKDIQVGSPLNKKISGGQRKRLNIALELIREPAVLFLDEPTSGLSSRDSENIMDLLKELSFKGKLVFVVIHQPSSDIFKMFDKLIILDTGGYIIYNGDPIDSIIYFKSRMHQANWNESECHACGNVNPEQVFNIVEINILDEYGKITRTRKISPLEWSAHYQEYAKNLEFKQASTTELPEISFKTPNGFRQFLVFMKRDVLSKLANTQYLVINFFEAPILAFILSYIIKFYSIGVDNQFGYTLLKNSNLPVYLFMSVIVAIFVGLTVSAEEIIKDRKILKRESFLNLSWSSYLLAKISNLFILSALQAFLFVIVGNSIMEIRGMYWQYWLVLFSAWASSNLMGLVISDSFKTVVTIYILIPFLVIPQIILSGIIVKYEKLNPAISTPSSIPWYGEIITARWGYEALSVYQFVENKYEKQFYKFDKAISKSDFKKNFWLKELNAKLDEIERDQSKSGMKSIIDEDLHVLQNEVSNEMESNKLIRFDMMDSLMSGRLSQILYTSLEAYFDKLEKYYNALNKSARNQRDDIISKAESTPEGKERLQDIQRKYYNENLADMAKSSNEIESDKILEFNGKLYQKYEPIFMDPMFKFVKAHFYAPRKMVFGQFYSTFWVNIVVIWIMTICLYFVLYFRLLKGLLDYFETIGDRLAKGK